MVVRKDQRPGLFSYTYISRVTLLLPPPLPLILPLFIFFFFISRVCQVNSGGRLIFKLAKARARVAQRPPGTKITQVSRGLSKFCIRGHVYHMTACAPPSISEIFKLRPEQVPVKRWLLVGASETANNRGARTREDVLLPARIKTYKARTLEKL